MKWRVESRKEDWEAGLAKGEVRMCIQIIEDRLGFVLFAEKGISLQWCHPWGNPEWCRLSSWFQKPPPHPGVWTFPTRSAAKEYLSSHQEELERTVQGVYTDWDPTYSGSFEFLGFSWNVSTAARILADNLRSSFALEAKTYRGLYEIVGRPYSDPKDLTVPVICVPYGNGLLPIDGWNRICAAIRDQRTLSAVRMTKDEAKNIISRTG